MARIILALCLLISSVVSAQPGYTTVNSRYKWIAGGFDSSLILPRYNGVPSGLRSAWNTDGQLAVDTANNRLYVYSGGAWVRVANYSDVGSTYTFPYSVVAPGNAIQLENDSIGNNIIYGWKDNRRGYYTPAEFGIIGNPTLQQVLDAGRIGDSIQMSNGATGEDYMIRHRNVGLGFPVVTLRPVSANKNFAIDFMPSGTPGDYSDNGISWIDVTDTDVSSGAGNTAAARVGITSTAVQFGSRNFGVAAKPVELIVNTDKRITLGISNTATFNIGKITQSQSLSGDYVGYFLLNTNNSVAESNPIFFIGNDFASNRFGYIRWNNGATSSGFRKPNQLEIMSNQSTNGGGMVLGSLGPNGKITFVTGSGNPVRGILDSAGNFGIGTATPEKLFHSVGTVRHASLGTASGDTTTYKPLGIDSNGDIIPMTYWPGGGGGTPSLTQYRIAVGDASNQLSDAAAITANRALISDANGVPTHSATTATELGYVSGVTSAIQTQLDTKISASSTNTLTNKRWTARVGTTTSSGTPTINTDNYDIYKLTAQAAAITSFTTNLTGTPNDGDILEIQITDDGTARAITWGASFVSSSVTLPATTTISTTLTVLFQYYTTSSYGNNKWVCVNYY